MFGAVGRMAVFLLALILLSSWTGSAPGCTVAVCDRALVSWFCWIWSSGQAVDQETRPVQSIATTSAGRSDGLRWGGEGPAGLRIEVHTDSRRLRVLFGLHVLMDRPVGVGKPNTPTPLGKWPIISKGKWGGGFGARWNGLSIPWGKYGIHGTNRPGSIGGYVSAGCVRMFNNDVIALYEMAPVGTTVAISGTTWGHFGEAARALRWGSRGRDVMHLQRILAAQNLYEGPVDGIFGAGTRTALRDFQARR